MSFEIKNKTFQKVFRGYSPDEVSEYLDYVEEEFEKIEKRAEAAEKRLVFALRKLDETSKRLEEITLAEKKREAAAEDVVAEADYTAKRITAEAKLKAAKIIKQATDTAENIMKQAEIDLAEASAKEEAIIRSTRKIYDEIGTFKDSLFDLYKMHIEAIDVLSVEAGEFIRRVDDVEDIDLEDISEISLDEPEIKFDEDETDDIVPETIPVEEPYEENETDIQDDGCITIDFEGEEELVSGEALEYASPEEDMIEDDVIFIGDGFETMDGENFYEDDGAAYGEEAPESEEVADLEDFFSDEGDSDMSLTDEFDMIFSSSNSGKNVDEIRRQPTVGAEEVPKHGWFDRKKK